MEKNLKLLIFMIFILAIIARLVFLDISYFVWDETVYLMHGKLIAGSKVGYEEVEIRPPLLQSILAVIWKFFPQNYELLSKIFTAVLNSFIVFPVYFLGRIVSRSAGTISSVIISLLPASILHSRYILADYLGALLALSSFVLFFIGAKENQKNKIYLGSVFIGLSILAKFTNLLLFIIIFPLWIFLALKHRKKEMFLSFLIIFIALLPFLAYNYIAYKNPLHTFIMAWKVVEAPLPIGLFFPLYLFYDTFGIIFLLLFIVGLALFIKNDILNKKISLESRLFSGFFIYAFFIVLIYFLNILNKGIAKPPTIEWEAGRFMLLLVPYIIVFASYFIDYFSNWFFKKGISKNLAIFFIILIGMLSLLPQYKRAYTPQIEFENGLRHITKEMGVFLRKQGIENIACIGNCPPIAYYSGKNIKVFYSYGGFINSGYKYKIAFKEIGKRKYGLLKRYCKEEWCVYLYRSFS